MVTSSAPDGPIYIGGLARSGKTYVPVSYTHLDVYKRQALRALESGADVDVEVSTPMVASPAEPVAPPSNGSVRKAARPRARADAGNATRRGLNEALQGEAE